MPVKIRCRGCQKVLNAPDKARGRVIKCPGCGTKLKVPGGDAKSKKPARAKKSVDDDDFLAGLDFSRAESEEEKVCPFCAAEMDPEDRVCRACGMNVTTGVMDRREAKRRARRGPDPAKFYGKAWSDSWAFLLKHWKLAMRTGVYWALFVVLLCACIFMMTYSRTGPPKFFWFCMTSLSGLGLLGWYWYLSMQIVESTMDRNDKALEYINFDIFQTIALGLRLAFWPIVVFFPPLPLFMYYGLLAGLFAVVVAAFTGQSEVLSATVAGYAAMIMGFAGIMVIMLLILAPFAICFFPTATVHMTQKYTYKAWILWELLIVSVRNLGPSLYFLFMALLLMVPMLLITVGPLILLLDVHSWGNIFFSSRVVGISPYDLVAETRPDPQINGWTERAIAWCLELVGERPVADNWLFRLIAIGVNITLAFLLYMPVCILLAFPAVFMMKVNGLLGYYNRERLGLVNQMAENTPANFWVRFLAHLVDLALWPYSWILVMKEKRALAIAWVINMICFLLGYFLPGFFVILGIPLFCAYDYWMYFTVSEISATRSTIGKDAFGLVVNDLDNRQISLKTGFMRWIGRLMCNVTLGLGYLIAAVHPEKRGLHDLVAGTRCCWKGDR